ncbi:MAG TPA: cold shock domain-containing protein [Nitrososphaerales archaeon]
MQEAEVIPLNGRITGRIIKISPSGWGFISSRAKPFTRIFFHWSGLLPTTKNFKELTTGMSVEFELVDYKDKGWRAFRIGVIEK